MPPEQAGLREGRGRGAQEKHWHETEVGASKALEGQIGEMEGGAKGAERQAPSMAHMGSDTKHRMIRVKGGGPGSGCVPPRTTPRDLYEMRKTETETNEMHSSQAP
jgi:hypothetical protein